MSVNNCRGLGLQYKYNTLYLRFKAESYKSQQTIRHLQYITYHLLAMAVLKPVVEPTIASRNPTTQLPAHNLCRSGDAGACFRSNYFPNPNLPASFDGRFVLVELPSTATHYY